MEGRHDCVLAVQEEASGEDYNVEEVDDGPRPFSALLDTGLKRTSTGSKVFAALKVKNLLNWPSSDLSMVPGVCTVSRFMTQRSASHSVPALASSSA